MKSASRAMKCVAAALSVVMFFTNVLFVHAAETNVWKDRQKAKDIQLAALPTNLQFGPATNRIPLINSVNPTFKQLSKNIPKGMETKYAPVLMALSNSCGTVRKISVPKTNVSNSPIVVHIQDVHLNPEAQSNIAKTVQELINQKQVSVVALEGAFEAIDFSVFRKFPHQQAVRTVADYLLEEKKISGAVHTAFSSPVEIPAFVGVDELEHYNANVDAYKQSAPLVKAEKKKLDALKKGLAEKKLKAYSLELSAFDSKVEAYRTGSMEWGAYVKYLSERSEAISTDVEMFLAALDMESKLDFKRVEAERTDLISKLVAKMDKAQTQDLVDHSVAYRSGSIGHADFYDYVKSLCHKNGIDLSRFPAMDAYIRYAILSDSINVDRIFADVAAMEVAQYALLAQNAEERALIAEGKKLYLTGKLLDFSLTKEEWSEYKQVVLSSQFSVLSKNLRTNSLRTENFEKFYEEAEIRDHKMAENLISSFPQSSGGNLGTVLDPRLQHAGMTSFAFGDDVAVLVTGGFHSSGIDAILNAAGYTTITFTPKISKIDENGSGYLGVFTQEKTPLDKLFAGEKLFVTPKVIPELNPAKALLAGVETIQVPTSKPADVIAALPGLPADTEIKRDGAKVNVVTKDGTYEINPKPAGKISARFNMSFRSKIIQATTAVSVLFGGISFASAAHNMASTVADVKPWTLGGIGIVGLIVVAVLATAAFVAYRMVVARRFVPAALPPSTPQLSPVDIIRNRLTSQSFKFGRHTYKFDNRGDEIFAVYRDGVSVDTIRVVPHYKSKNLVIIGENFPDDETMAVVHEALFTPDLPIDGFRLFLNYYDIPADNHLPGTGLEVQFRDPNRRSPLPPGTVGYAVIGLLSLAGALGGAFPAFGMDYEEPQQPKTDEEFLAGMNLQERIGWYLVLTERGLDGKKVENPGVEHNGHTYIFRRAHPTLHDYIVLRDGENICGMVTISGHRHGAVITSKEKDADVLAVVEKLVTDKPAFKEIAKVKDTSGAGRAMGIAVITDAAFNSLIEGERGGETEIPLENTSDADRVGSYLVASPDYEHEGHRYTFTRLDPGSNEYAVARDNKRKWDIIDILPTNIGVFVHSRKQKDDALDVVKRLVKDQPGIVGVNDFRPPKESVDIMYGVSIQIAHAGKVDVKDVHSSADREMQDILTVIKYLRPIAQGTQAINLDKYGFMQNGHWYTFFQTDYQSPEYRVDEDGRELDHISVSFRNGTVNIELKNGNANVRTAIMLFLLDKPEIESLTQVISENRPGITILVNLKSQAQRLAEGNERPKHERDLFSFNLIGYIAFGLAGMAALFGMPRIGTAAHNVASTVADVKPWTLFGIGIVGWIVIAVIGVLLVILSFALHSRSQHAPEPVDPMNYVRRHLGNYSVSSGTRYEGHWYAFDPLADNVYAVTRDGRRYDMVRLGRDSSSDNLITIGATRPKQDTLDVIASILTQHSWPVSRVARFGDNSQQGLHVYFATGEYVPSRARLALPSLLPFLLAEAVGQAGASAFDFVWPLVEFSAWIALIFWVLNFIYKKFGPPVDSHSPDQRRLSWGDVRFYLAIAALAAFIVFVLPDPNGALGRDGWITELFEEGGFFHIDGFIYGIVLTVVLVFVGKLFWDALGPRYRGSYKDTGDLILSHFFRLGTEVNYRGRTYKLSQQMRQAGRGPVLIVGPAEKQGDEPDNASMYFLTPVKGGGSVYDRTESSWHLALHLGSPDTIDFVRHLLEGQERVVSVQRINIEEQRPWVLEIKMAEGLPARVGPGTRAFIWTRNKTKNAIEWIRAKLNLIPDKRSIEDVLYSSIDAGAVYIQDEMADYRAEIVIANGKPQIHIVSNAYPDWAILSIDHVEGNNLFKIEKIIGSDEGVWVLEKLLEGNPRLELEKRPIMVWTDGGMDFRVIPGQFDLLIKVKAPLSTRQILSHQNFSLRDISPKLIGYVAAGLTGLIALFGMPSIGAAAETVQKAAPELLAMVGNPVSFGTGILATIAIGGAVAMALIRRDPELRIEDMTPKEVIFAHLFANRRTSPSGRFSDAAQIDDGSGRYMLLGQDLKKGGARLMLMRSENALGWFELRATSDRNVWEIFYDRSSDVSIDVLRNTLLNKPRILSVIRRPITGTGQWLLQITVEDETPEVAQSQPVKPRRVPPTRVQPRSSTRAYVERLAGEGQSPTLVPETEEVVQVGNRTLDPEGGSPIKNNRVNEFWDFGVGLTERKMFGLIAGGLAGMIALFGAPSIGAAAEAVKQSAPELLAMTGRFGSSPLGFGLVAFGLPVAILAAVYNSISRDNHDDDIASARAFLFKSLGVDAQHYAARMPSPFLFAIQSQPLVATPVPGSDEVWAISRADSSDYTSTVMASLLENRWMLESSLNNSVVHDLLMNQLKTAVPFLKGQNLDTENLRRTMVYLPFDPSKRLSQQQIEESRRSFFSTFYSDFNDDLGSVPITTPPNNIPRVLGFTASATNIGGEKWALKIYGPVKDYLMGTVTLELSGENSWHVSTDNELAWKVLREQLRKNVHGFKADQVDNGWLIEIPAGQWQDKFIEARINQMQFSDEAEKSAVFARKKLFQGIEVYHDSLEDDALSSWRFSKDFMEEKPANFARYCDVRLGRIEGDREGWTLGVYEHMSNDLIGSVDMVLAKEGEWFMEFGDSDVYAFRILSRFWIDRESEIEMTPATGNTKKHAGWLRISTSVLGVLGAFFLINANSVVSAAEAVQQAAPELLALVSNSNGPGIGVILTLGIGAAVFLTYVRRHVGTPISEMTSKEVIFENLFSGGVRLTDIVNFEYDGLSYMLSGHDNGVDADFVLGNSERGDLNLKLEQVPGSNAWYMRSDSPEALDAVGSLLRNKPRVKYVMRHPDMGAYKQRLRIEIEPATTQHEPSNAVAKIGVALAGTIALFGAPSIGAAAEIAQQATPKLLAIIGNSGSGIGWIVGFGIVVGGLKLGNYIGRYIPRVVDIFHGRVALFYPFKMVNKLPWYSEGKRNFKIRYREKFYYEAKQSEKNRNWNIQIMDSEKEYLGSVTLESTGIDGMWRLNQGPNALVVRLFRNQLIKNGARSVSLDSFSETFDLPGNSSNLPALDAQSTKLSGSFVQKENFDVTMEPFGDTTEAWRITVSLENYPLAKIEAKLTDKGWLLTDKNIDQPPFILQLLRRELMKKFYRPGKIATNSKGFDAPGHRVIVPIPFKVKAMKITTTMIGYVAGGLTAMSAFFASANNAPAHEAPRPIAAISQPSEKLESPEAREIDNNIKQRAPASLNVAHMITPIFDTPSQKAVRAFEQEYTKAIENKDGATFSTMGDALEDGFNTQKDVAAVLFINNEDDLANVDKAVAAAKKSGDAVAMVITNQADESVAEKAQAKADSLGSKIAIALVRESAGITATTFNVLFAQLATVMPGQHAEARALFTNLANDRTANSKVMVLGESSVQYSASEALLAIMFSFVITAGVALVIRMQAILHAAKMA